jgi:hypothetical protein
MPANPQRPQWLSFVQQLQADTGLTEGGTLVLLCQWLDQQEAAQPGITLVLSQHLCELLGVQPGEPSAGEANAGVLTPAVA